MQPHTKRPSIWVNRHKVARPTLTTMSPTDPTGPTGGGPLSTLLASARRGEVAPPIRSNFVPVSEWEKYVLLLETHGFDKSIVDSVREKHEKYYEANPTVPRRPSSDDIFTLEYDYTDQVKVHTEIIGKEVKITTTVPFENFNKVTPRETLGMYKLAGVSTVALAALERKITKWEKSQEGRDMHLHLVMDKYNGKIPAKKKPKPLKHRFAKKTVNILKNDDGYDYSEGEP